MIVITGVNGRVGLTPAVDVLRSGGSALDAVEAGARAVELSPDDHSVGLGGYPNLLGVVEVDAGIMDGRTRAVGAVAAIRDYAHPVSIARQVMERLPHVLLVGEGAERFAAEVGAQRLELLTPKAEAAWRERLSAWAGVDPNEVTSREQLAELVWRAVDDRRRSGTVDFLALDARGDLAVAVSTSGFAWKYPGRVGDSPIAGAGYYADNRYGAAACTGVGELAIRAGTARSLVLRLQMGTSLEGAGRAVMRDLARLAAQDIAGGRGGPVGMSVLALDPQGRAVGYSDCGDDTYLAMTPAMHEPEVRPRIVVGVA